MHENVSLQREERYANKNMSPGAIVMNNIQRFLTALERGEPDRVPTFELEFNEASILNLGRYFTDDLPPAKPFLDCTPNEIRKYYDVLIKFIRELDIDSISAVFTAGGTRIEGKPNYHMDDLGVVYKHSEHGDPFPVDGPIQNAEDLKNYRMPDVTSDHFEIFRYLREQAPEKALVFIVPGPFKLSWGLMGALQKMLLAYAMTPDLCLQLARMTTDFALSAIEMAISEGADVILLDGDISLQKTTMMSPAHYRKFLKPFHKECVDLVHDKGLPMIKHSDGNFWPVMDDLIEIGFDGLHPIQPQCMDIKDVKNHVRGKACIVGNIDCAELLPFGDENDVIAAVKETIREIAPGGGYILSSSNSIHPACKAKNVVAMFEAVKKYGVYPITF
jgi:uroporphyrinogen decarboxylase